MKVENTGEESTPTAKVPEETPPHKLRKHMTLEELLEGIPEGTCLGEYDWGPPRGAEIWWEMEDEPEEPEERA
jgi:hypothetical protein